MPTFAAQTCAAAGGVGTLARLDLDGLGAVPSAENFALLTPDASAVIVVSSGPLEFGRNPLTRPALFEIPLTGSRLSARQLSQDPGLLEAVAIPTISGDGSIVAYTLDRLAAADASGDDYLADVFVLNPTRGSDAAVDDPPGSRPAMEPFDLELVGCTASAGVASIDLRLRQWRGGPRTVVVTGEIEDESAPGVFAGAGPVIQKIGDQQTVEFRLTAPFTGSLPRCTARAVDGAASHPDVATAWSQP